MTPDEARKVASAIADTWPGRGPSIERWIEPLQRHTLDDARTTYRWFRDNAEHPPSIAQFLAKHRELHTATAQRLREPCATCDGTGWEQITVQRPGYPHETSGVVPCRCTNGRSVDDAHRRAVEHNETELRRTRPLASGSAA